MHRNRSTRDGFTLLELMVVLVILGILVALSAAAVVKYIAVSQSSATETTIRKVYSRLQAQRAAVVKAAQTEDMLKILGATNLGTLQTAAGYPTLADWPQRSRVIYTKLRLIQEFPSTFAEALAPPLLSAKPSYVKAFTGLTAGQPYESSACLLLALQQGRGGSVVSADDYGSSSVKLFKDPSTSAMVQALVDGWGTPLAYYRWPWGNSEVDALAPPVQVGTAGTAVTAATVVRDPEDPMGLLLNTTWYTMSSNGPRTTFEGWCHSVTNSSQSPSNPGYPQYAYYMVPAVVSAGPNLQLGLTSQGSTSPGPMAPDGTNSDSDNIYSFRLSPPGARGD